MNRKFFFMPLAILGLSQTCLMATTVVTELETDSTWYPLSGGSGSNANPAFWTNSFTTTNNVLYGLSPSSSSGNFSAESGTGTVGSLTDGLSSLTKAQLATVGGAGGSQVTYTLTSATQLSSIVYYGGWTDGGRSDALFNVSYSTDNGANYTLLLDPDAPDYSVVGDSGRQNLTTVGTGGYDSTRTFSKWIGGSGVVTNMVTVTDNSGTIGNGANITNLRFDFFGGRNGFDGAIEIGAYAVPEPGLTSLLAIGSLSLMVRRRR